MSGDVGTKGVAQQPPSRYCTASYGSRDYRLVLEHRDGWPVEPGFPAPMGYLAIYIAGAWKYFVLQIPSHVVTLDARTVVDKRNQQSTLEHYATYTNTSRMPFGNTKPIHF